MPPTVPYMNKNIARTISGLQSQIDIIERHLSQVKAVLAQLHEDAQAEAGKPAVGDKLLLSVKEAAEYTGLSEWVIRQLCRDDVLAATWFGRTIRIARAELDRYCDTLIGTGA